MTDVSEARESLRRQKHSGRQPDPARYAAVRVLHGVAQLAG